MNKVEKIKSYNKDLEKLNAMITLLDNTENLCGTMYSDILESINNTKNDIERIINNLYNLKAE